MQQYIIAYPLTKSTGINSDHQVHTDNSSVIGLFVVILPALVLIGITAHRKYRAVRRRKKITTLEKSWSLNCISSPDEYL